MSADAAQKLQPLVAYVCSDEGADVARALAAQTKAGPDALNGGGLSGAARVSTGVRTAQTVLTEIGNISVSMACECISEIHKTGAEVIVLGQATDIATYRALRQAGAVEYFPLPVTAEEIQAVRAAAPANDAAPIAQVAAAPRGRTIGIVGCTGGAGASLLAQNMAFYATAAKKDAPRVALIDADLRFGAQALDLDCEETAGFADALSATARVDDTYLQATMSELRPNLWLYAQCIYDATAIHDLDAALPDLAAPLKDHFDSVIFDLPRHLLLDQPAMAASLDVLVMVIPAGYVGVNAATRLISRMQGQHPDLQIRPVLSDLRRDAGLTAKDIAGAVGMPIAATLPRADAPVLKSRRTARPLVELQPRGAYAKATQSLWQKASAAQCPTPAKPKGLWRFLK